MDKLQQTNRFLADKVNELRTITDILNESVQSGNQSTEAIADATGKLKAIVDGFKIRQ